MQACTKHHLRAHTYTMHSPAWMKLHRCECSDCSKSFAVNQKLQAHRKTYDKKLYTCSHLPCLLLRTLPLFSTRMKLQAHTRTAHPPTSPYAECNSKSFGQQKGLEAHLAIHKEGAVYGQVNIGELEARKRRGREHGRDWICCFEGCAKAFKLVFPLLDSTVAFSQLYVEQKNHLARITTSRTSTNATLSALGEVVASPAVTNISWDGLLRPTNRWSRAIAPRAIMRKAFSLISTEYREILSGEKHHDQEGLTLSLSPVSPSIRV